MDLLRRTAWGGLLCLGLFLTSPVQAEDCFHVALPKGAKEHSVPPKLDMIRVNGVTAMTAPGFWIFDGGKNLVLSGPARFCLEQDIVRKVGLMALLGEPGGLGELVELYGSDIVFDLNRHALRSDRAGTAIASRVWGMLEDPKKRNYTFRNGTIDVKGSGILLQGWQYGGQPHTTILTPRDIERATRWYGANFREFADTNIVLENLTIKTGALAAYLVGRNNIIRHCRIEVEGSEAIVLIGANAQLIDNEIVVKRRFAPAKNDNSMPELGTYYAEFAAIWIRDAPGAIIRGNTITIAGRGSAKEAILLVNSPNITIENNKVTGADRLFTALDTTSSAHARDNRKWVGKWPEN